SGLRWPVGCMGAQIGDFDNDGNLDIFFGTGDPTPERLLEPSRVYRNRGSGTFEEVTWKWGLTGHGKGHGITVADFDHDGRLDVRCPSGAREPVRALTPDTRVVITEGKGVTGRTGLSPALAAR